MEIAEEPETTLDTLIAAHGILRETSCYEIAEQGILKSQINAPEYLALLEEILRLCPPRQQAEMFPDLHFGRLLGRTALRTEP